MARESAVMLAHKSKKMHALQASVCAWLLLYCGIAVSAFEATSEICDRSASRDAKFIMSSIIAPRVELTGYQLPSDCPLDAARDMFGVQESNKHVVRKGVWRCGFDDKVFRGELFIDKHMDNKHAEETKPEATACLADMCGILHCDFFAAYKTGGVSALRHLPCHIATMEKNKMQCEDVVHRCFPPHKGRTVAGLHAYMMSNFCAAATCRWKEREQLLKPLAKERNGKQFLWSMLVWATLITVAAVYAVLACRWSNRSPCGRGSILELLRVKRPQKKLY